jgi:tRNA pseudouridine55 synthase
MPTSGLLFLDKPYGMTSFQIVNSLKKRFKWKKVGHAGTLDPLATGVLLICTEKATRAIPFLQELKKRYQAQVRLGIETETQDREGDLIKVYTGANYPSPGDIQGALERFKGEIEQTPPMFSALWYKGRRLYEWARQGNTVPRAPRKVWIYEIEYSSYRYPFLNLNVVCSKGTYIRTLAADIGNALGVGGYIWGLRRSGVGGYTIHDALVWEEVMKMDLQEIEAHIIPWGQVLNYKVF